MLVKIDQNIFKQTGVKDPEVAMFKAEIVQTILDIFERKKYKQIEAAKVLKVKQPVVSDLANGRLYKFTIDRLLHFLFLLGWGMKVEVSKLKKNQKNNLKYKQVNKI